MSDNISQDEKKIIKQSINAFTKLLKEFPKNAAGDFIYDGSTLTKIGNAGDALTGMTALLSKEETSLEETEKNMLKESYSVLSRLMAEMPKKSTDDFSYDRAIHQLVEKAREAVKKLNHITTGTA
ncbi:MAG: hypothetical protein KAW12_08045 [Candidatus Aminicenantes bacterium]|nr:hypothetical protein [Candidatus Aminicenantes bacterium]